MPDDDFAERLGKLVSRELPQARKDPERLAIMVEKLIAGAGLAIAVGCNGDPKSIEAMLQGVEAYLYESAAQYAGVGTLTAEIDKRSRPQTEGW